MRNYTKDERGQAGECIEEARFAGGYLGVVRRCNSEKGVVLVVVLILSAVSLLVITALMYMIITGTQMSGLYKRYRTAVEAARGGADIFQMAIDTQGTTDKINTLVNEVNTYTSDFALSGLSACSASYNGKTYIGLDAKLMAPSTSWVNCDKSLAIDPANSSTYDMKVVVGTITKFNVYAKIIAMSTGNTGAPDEWWTKGVVTAYAEQKPAVVTALYSVEVMAVNNANTDERAKLSALYQY